MPANRTRRRTDENLGSRSPFRGTSTPPRSIGRSIFRAGLAGFAALLAASAAMLVTGCGVGDFDAQNKITGVRILATRADKPYALPGDQVTVEMLAADGRKDTTTRPMRLWWLPVICADPYNDLYYACFANLPGTGSGAPAEGGGDVKLSDLLVEGPKFTFTMPSDIIDKHPPVAGSADAYGLAILFNIACAGHVDVVPPSGDSRTSLPLGCFDDDGNQLGPSEYVVGFTRVYARTTVQNANPTIDGLTFQGEPVDLTAGITVDVCGASDRINCADQKVDISVPPDSQEPNPDDKDSQGNPRQEQVWVDYYATVGDFEGEIRLLYDPVRGKIEPTDTNYHGPDRPGDGTMFAVVHDNRGGATWVDFPVHTR
jgi:hypothetical protein